MTATLDLRTYRKDGTPRTSKKANSIRAKQSAQRIATERAEQTAYMLSLKEARATAPRTQEAEAVYDDANRIVNRALHNIERNTPTPTIKQLIDFANADTHARRNAQIQAVRREAEVSHAKHAEQVSEYRRQAKRKTQTDRERQTAEKNLAEASEAMRADTEDMALLDESTVLSFRADLVQEALAAMYEWKHGNGRSQKVCYEWWGTPEGVKRFARPCKSAQESASTIQALYTALHEVREAVEGASPEEIACVINKAIDTQARGRYCTNAVSRYIHSTKSPVALNTTHTDSRKATPEDIAQFTWRFGGEAMNPDYARIVTPSGYLTLRVNPETHNAEVVHHRQTIRQNQTIFTGTSEDGTNETQYVHRASAYELTMADLDDFADLVSVAQLTDRERRFLKALQMPEAQTAGQTAADDYTRKHFVNGHWDGKPSECIKARSNARFNAWRSNALEKIGLHHGTPTASNFWHRLTDKLRSAAPHAHRSKRTPEAIALAHLMQSSYRGNPLTATPRPDLIGALEGTDHGKTLVKWLTDAEAKAHRERVRADQTHREYIDHTPTTAKTPEEAEHARRLYAEAEARKKAIAEAEATAKANAHRDRMQKLTSAFLTWEELQEKKPWLDKPTTAERTPECLQEIPGTPYATTRTPKK